jgi:hypothetical protein
MPKVADKQKTERKPGTIYLSQVCPVCEKKGGAYLAHYGVMRCACGHFSWALQPQRGGPLVLFPHPGFWAKEERAAA